jgi:hypothetical protein
MKQLVTLMPLSLVRNLSLVFVSLSLMFVACSKKDHDTSNPATAAFAGQYLVVDDNETYTLKIESTGGNGFQIKEFGGFMNVPVKANVEGTSLKIPSQTFTNGSGHSITITGSGSLSTKGSKDDTITFSYSVTGYAAHSGSFSGTRQ